ncbi:hypothetical protein A3K55_02435 [Candidatus Shapirobacteria bacterium RBG_13_44_7]|uniref:2'-deoxynucleoside 5'-phosphate N-hydrolase 1 n=1 Tax=Candidatus Shapirobacteria bacterium RBG_13_44_7 TaxID=1802149 RepID=A0A1F7SKJ1_9BACT|nr:MAG: hypothetical protein A3K55_02435 [Candidatus Shapirobacteria bacterium RBG_13_44_7]
MKVYFTAALRGRKLFLKNYETIVKYLRELGYEVNTCDVLDDGIEDRVARQTEEDRIEAHCRLSRLLRNADVVVVEVSVPSTSLGYEITEALFLEKPVVVLYARGGNHPTLLEGRKDEKLQMMEYDLGGLKKLLEQAMIEAEKMLDVRFNFFVNQKIRDYLERVAKERRVPKSVFIRGLIEREMKKEER